MPRLEAKILECKNLDCPGLLGLTPIPYVKLTVEGNTIKLKGNKSATTSPSWPNCAVMEFVVSDPRSTQLQIEVFGKTTLGSDDPLGHYYVSLDALKEGMDVDQWYPLKNSRSGEVRVIMRMLDLPRARAPDPEPTQPPSSPPPHWGPPQWQGTPQPYYPPPPPPQPSLSSPRPSSVRRFHFQDLCMITNNWSDMIGQGGFGQVYAGMFEGQAVVVKRISGLNGVGGHVAEEEFHRELQPLLELRHPNVVHIVGFCDDAPGQKGLVFPRMTPVNAEELRKLQPAERFNILRDVANGLLYLHMQNRVHRDVKPDNLLLRRGGMSGMWVGVIADLGLTRVQLAATRNIAHSSFLDPSADVSHPATTQDVYAFALTMLCVYSGILFPHEHPGGQNGLLARVGAEAPALADLARRMLHPNPRERPTMDQAVRELA